MHHYDAIIANPSIKYGGTETNKAIIPDVTGPMNQSHVSNTGIFSNPNRIFILVIPHHTPFF
jgi:hypothetical protein